MGRQAVFRFMEYPALVSGRKYRVRVAGVKNTRGGIEVELLFLAKEQEGNTYSVLLSSEVLPNGLTMRFISACGKGQRPEVEMAARELIGAEVIVVFGPAHDRGVGVVDFEAAGKEGN